MSIWHQSDYSGGKQASLATVGGGVQGWHLDALSAGYWRDKKTKHMLSSGFQMFLVSGLRELESYLC